MDDQHHDHEHDHHGHDHDHDGDVHNLRGEADGAVEADTASGGAPEDPDPAVVGIGGDSPARAAQVPDDEDDAGDIPPENPSGG